MSDILLVKREVLNTTSSRGWHLITERAEAVIQDLTNKAIDEENKEKSDQLVLEARAARKFWRQLLASLEASKNADTTDEGWYEVADS